MFSICWPFYFVSCILCNCNLVLQLQWNEKIDDVVAGLDGPSGLWVHGWMDGCNLVLHICRTAQKLTVVDFIIQWPLAVFLRIRVFHFTVKWCLLWRAVTVSNWKVSPSVGSAVKPRSTSAVASASNGTTCVDLFKLFTYSWETTVPMTTLCHVCQVGVLSLLILLHIVNWWQIWQSC